MYLWGGKLSLKKKDERLVGLTVGYVCMCHMHVPVKFPVFCYFVIFLFLLS